MRLGYYAQAPFIEVDGKPFIPFDYAVWADEFPKYVNEFHFILNRKGGINNAPVSYSPLPENCKLHDLGLLQPNWKRAMGLGLNSEQVREITKNLDAFIVQGPTPMQLHLVRHSHPGCVVAPLLVGMWHEWPSTMYRVFPKYREYLINLLKRLNRWQTTRLINQYDILFLGNNPLNPAYYRSKKPFHLISKGLVRKSEINPPKPPLSRTTKNLVFFSRVEPEKNVELLIRTVSEVIKEHPVILEIFGDNSTPTYLSYLKKLVSNLNAEKYVHFMGGVPFHEKQKVFENADIYIFNTCTTEGFPRTIWEGFSYGIPTLSVAYPGAREFFKDGEHLVLFEQNNLESLIAQLNRLIEDQSLREKIVAGAYMLLNEHTSEKSVSRIFSILVNEVNARKSENFIIDEQ